MVDCFCFHIEKSVPVDEAWKELEIAGIPLLYSSEEIAGKKEIYGYIPPSLPLESIQKELQTIASITRTTLDIDWSEQWALHAPDYKEGFVHVDLHPFGINQILHLQPGPGFGDLSHATTRLMLKLMNKRIKGQHIVDIGTGSGVLALCGVAMGAASMKGVDIDKQAIEHAKKNAELNQLHHDIEFTLPENTLPPETKSIVVLMNMIRSEQREAWNTLSCLHHFPGFSIVSGVLAKERADYLKQCEEWGWTLFEEIEEQGWLGFCFER